jgi:hypothetical protein
MDAVSHSVIDQMNADHLRTYMKDHYAGSVAALQLLDHLVSTKSGKPQEMLLIALRHEVGIEGKRALWHALEAVASEAPTLRKVNFDQLHERAETQRKRVEALRIEAAREAFALS